MFFYTVSVRMVGSSLEDTMHSSKESPSTCGAEPVPVVKLRRVLRTGLEGVKSEVMGIRSQADHGDVEQLTSMGGIYSTLKSSDDQLGFAEDVEVIKKEGRVNRRKKSGIEDLVSAADKVEVMVEFEKACNSPHRACETHTGERLTFGSGGEVSSKSLSPAFEVGQDNMLKMGCNNLELDIDAKLKELKLKNPSMWGGVEVEEMTSADYYYDPLGHYAVHEETLKDDSRVQTWQQVSNCFDGNLVPDQNFYHQELLLSA